MTSKEHALPDFIGWMTVEHGEKADFDNCVRAWMQLAPTRTKYDTIAGIGR